MLQAQYGTNSMSLAQVFTNTAIKESFDFSFKLAINSATVGNDYIRISIGSSSTNVTGGLDFGVLKYADGLGFTARQSAPGGSSYATRIGSATMGLNEWYTFTLSLDWDTLTFSGNVYNSTNALVTSFSNIAIWDRDGTMHAYGFDKISVGVTQSSTAYVLVDDITVAVPEPTSIALLVFSAAGLLLMRHRRRNS